jgi:hypothetical protein
VDDRSRVILATLLGAGIGGTLGYFYLTEAGARARQRIEPRLDDFIAEMRRMRATAEKARTAADEGWRTLNELVGEESRGPGWQPGGTRQTSH